MKKKTHEVIEFHLTKFKIELLLSFTGSRKVLGKIPQNLIRTVSSLSNLQSYSNSTC